MLPGNSPEDEEESALSPTAGGDAFFHLPGQPAAQNRNRGEP